MNCKCSRQSDGQPEAWIDALPERAKTTGEGTLGNEGMADAAGRRHQQLRPVPLDAVGPRGVEYAIENRSADLGLRAAQHRPGAQHIAKFCSPR